MTIAAKQLSSANADRIRTEFFETEDPDAALEQRTTMADALLLEAYRQHLFPVRSNGLALLAVGGYGRRQLFPFSDVDLLLLFQNDDLATSIRAPIAAFLQQLWDAGLRLSHSVRTPAECSELHAENIELTISLLDQRFLTGDPAVYAALLERLPRFVHGQRDHLIRDLSRHARERHAKYANTVYHLEPNLKEAPGGLRDFQLLCWLDQIKRATGKPLSPAEAPADLEEARRLLFLLRFYLHYEAGRDNNTITFDAQDWIAEHARPRTPRTAAQWMAEYFRTARTVHRSAARRLETSEAQGSSLFAQFRDRRSRLSNADFTVVRERVHFRVPQKLDADPELPLRLFDFVARHGIRLSMEAEHRMASRVPAIRDYFAESRPVWPSLREILLLPHAALALRAMHETGFLRALFPELDEIDSLVIRDFYHRYTVDEHTLVTIQTLEELKEKPYADLMSEVEQRSVLYFALLFHDAGKGNPDEGHVESSARIAEAAMQRIQMPPADRETVRLLILNHLEMSSTMNSRDLSDPATGAAMAHRVGTVEFLKYLTLLTYGDISAVNPSAMSPWRAEQLWRLYLLTYNELTRALETERIGTPDGPRSAFLEGFPTRYLRTHSDREIEQHQRLAKVSQERGVAVELERRDHAYRATVVTTDRTFLFASVAGTLSSFGMNILKAEAFANRHGMVLDTFTFSDPLRTLELNPSEMDRLHATLERVILGGADVQELLKSRPKFAPWSRNTRLSPTVQIDNEASGASTLIQIVAEDRPGLLYDLAAGISSQRCNIEVVLIDTEAQKAIDVFYVTADGAKLTAEKQQILRDELLKAVAP
jgi:[protein-PII] uridylyltransferase